MRALERKVEPHGGNWPELWKLSEGSTRRRAGRRLADWRRLLRYSDDAIIAVGWTESVRIGTPPERNAGLFTKRNDRNAVTGIVPRNHPGASREPGETKLKGEAWCV